MKKLITITINNNIYDLNVEDIEAIKNISEDDSQQLITLLEVIKLQKIQASPAINSSTISFNHIDNENLKTEDLGDVDALMARLAMEERNKNIKLTNKTFYKLIATTTLIIIALIALI